MDTCVTMSENIKSQKIASAHFKQKYSIRRLLGVKWYSNERHYKAVDHVESSCDSQHLTKTQKHEL